MPFCPENESDDKIYRTIRVIERDIQLEAEDEEEDAEQWVKDSWTSMLKQCYNELSKIDKERSLFDTISQFRDT